LQRREAGSVLVPVKIPESVGLASTLQSLVMKAEGAANHRPWKRMRADRYSDEVGKRLEAGFFIPATNYVNALQYRTCAPEDFLATVLSEVGALHTAVMPITTPTLEQTTYCDGLACPCSFGSVIDSTRTRCCTSPRALGSPPVKQPLADGLLGDRQSRHFPHLW
jgi:hypothetical protein